MSEKLQKEKHIKFILDLMRNKEIYEYWMTIAVRTNNYYWGIGALYLFGGLDRLDKQETLDYILACQAPTGGFGGNIGSLGGVEFVENLGGIPMGGKTRYITLITDDPLTRSVFEWLQTSEGQSALQ